MSDFLTTCGLPGCWALYEQTEGAGRPRRYCSDEHRREADTMRKRAIARLAQMRELARRDEHLLAALGGDAVPEPPRCCCGKYPLSPDHCLTLFDRDDTAVERHAVGACEAANRATTGRTDGASREPREWSDPA